MRSFFIPMTRLQRAVIGSLLALSFASVAASQALNDPLKEAQRLTRVAQVAEQQARYVDAIKAYETIAVIAKSSPKTAAAALLNAGDIYMIIGKFPEAVAAFRRSLTLDPSLAAAQNNMGEALGELKQYQAALKAFQQAIALDSGFVKARYNMGVTYEKMGQLRYAEFVYRILIRDHPDFALAYDSMAVTLSKSGRSREAIPFHQKATTMSPKDPSFHFNFAISYLMLGDLKNAREQQQQLQALDPNMAQHLATAIARRK
jgi:tetratricopeptide (TPR) repeat protein